jgi:hypothetical protein
MSSRFIAALTPRLAPIALATTIAIAASGAHAGIDFAPASIVDHGSYISDTVNHLDWYKFSNLATTVGQSYDSSVAQFGALGWISAGLTQVQGLQSQFGWTADTFDFGPNANFGLTIAMGAYLGYTYDDVFEASDTQIQETAAIRAMTWDGFCVGNDCDQNTTDSEVKTFVTLIDGQNTLTSLGDFVDGSEAYQFEGTAVDGVGTWLVRESASDGCSRLAPIDCGGPTPALPEPETWALTLLGLIGILLSRRTH